MCVEKIFVFSLKVHPKHKWYTQCLDYKFNANPVEDPHLYKIYQITFLIYQIIISILTFFLPLIVIIFTYTCILLKIIRSRHSFQTGKSAHTQCELHRLLAFVLLLLLLLNVVLLLQFARHFASRANEAQARRQHTHSRAYNESREHNAQGESQNHQIGVSHR